MDDFVLYKTTFENYIFREARNEYVYINHLLDSYRLLCESDWEFSQRARIERRGNKDIYCFDNKPIFYTERKIEKN